MSDGWYSPDFSSREQYRRHRNSGRDWVYPDQDNRTPEESPYGYTDFFIWRNGSRESLKGANAEYSDRMQQWDYKKFEAACDAGPKKQFRYWPHDEISKFLTAYFGKPVTAVALSEGCNVSNGYPYFVFWFRDAG